MVRERDTPFDPDAVPRLLATGAVPPEVFFAPGRRDGPPFEVIDEKTANWVVRKINEVRAYADHVEEYARRELRRCEREEQFFLTHYGPQLEAWATAEIKRRGGKLKRVRLPAGAVGFRSVAAKLGITDELKVLAWCKAHLPNAVVRAERLLKGLIRRHVEATGECPDGVEVVPPGQKFFVE